MPLATFIDGLLESTEADNIAYAENIIRRSTPLATAWQDANNSAKVIQWDSDLERYLQQRQALIAYEGNERLAPWNLYTSLGLAWQDGYNYAQQSGDCASMGHKNSLKTAAFLAAYLASPPSSQIPNPKSLISEIYPCATYAFARGNGKPSFGSGLNLNRMQDYACRIGNYTTADMGAYDCGRATRRWQPSEQQRSHALQHQSVLIPLPSFDFDTVYNLCDGGIGVCFGTGRYPTTGIVNSYGLAVPRQWKNGGHAMGFTWAAERGGNRYVFLENSHGNSRYPEGQFGHGSGLWIDSNSFDIIAKTGTRYGIGYGHVMELPRLS